MSKRALIATIALIIIGLAVMVGAGRAQTARLPLLANGDFEEGAGQVPIWRCEEPGPICEWYGPVPEISTPEGWTVWFRHSDVWGQPEVKVINSGPPWDDPPRVFSGTQAIELFTFYRPHDLGLFQEFPTEPGQQYVASAWVHNWCSSDQNPDPTSDCNPGSISQTLGVDLGGEIDPFAPGVVWSASHEIYDTYQQISLTFTAVSTETTLFTRSWSQWGVRNNNAYVDLVEITPMEFSPVYTIHLPIVKRSPFQGNKLGVHVLRDGTGLREFIAAGPAVVKFVGDWGLSDLVSPGTTIIGSVPTHFDAQGLYNAGYTPEQAARMFVSAYRPIIQANPAIEYWTGSNEPVGDHAFIAWYASEEIWRMQLLEAMGEKAVIGNFATGNPPLEQWPSFLHACEYARDNGHLLGLHEYSTPWLWWMTNGWQLDPNGDIGKYGWTTLRYRWVYDLYLIPAGLGDLRLVIAEAGADPSVRPWPTGRIGCAWRGCCADWCALDGRCDCEQFYVEQLLWYENQLKQDPPVIGMTIFTIGAWPGPWLDFDIREDVIWLLTDYLGAG